MVAIGEHDHGDGELCPGCRFREALAEFLEGMAGEPESAWHDATAEIILLMNGAMVALNSLRASRSGGDLHHDDHATMAAAAISRLGGKIEELYDAIMRDDGDDLADDQQPTG